MSSPFTRRSLPSRPAGAGVAARRTSVSGNSAPLIRLSLRGAARRHKSEKDARAAERKLCAINALAPPGPLKKWRRGGTTGGLSLFLLIARRGAARKRRRIIMNTTRKLLTSGLIGAVFAAGVAASTPASAFRGGWTAAAGTAVAGGAAAAGAAAAGPMAAGAVAAGPAAAGAVADGLAPAGAEAVWAMPAGAAAGAVTGAAAGAGIIPTPMTSAGVAVVRAAAAITEPVTEPVSRARRLERRRLERSGPASATAPVGGEMMRARVAMARAP